jgi:8-oxo-(d)GTP phosphatase
MDDDTSGRGEERAAGAVLWRPLDEDLGTAKLEVAIVHRPRYDDWSLPKGKLVPGETELEAALREVQEETGHRGRPGRSLGTVRYLKTSGGVTPLKVVRFWAMQADGGTFTSGDEIDRLRWVTVDDARRLLTHPTDREVLGRFASQGPDATRAS